MYKTWRIRLVTSSFSRLLTLLDFFLWRELKNIVHLETRITPENMRQRITAACGGINSEAIRRARDSAMQRSQLCIGTNGQHFEHFLQCIKISFAIMFHLK
ncbi:hypothetical protein WH47_01290 [Habropoda laboriosa]|uniref:Uncharacterized protein n=1 Tax=Habropoda laboriosa TaxID=597456 RepID=A0A0L7QZD0_9HYME|nr:hypothetical protein WH47_01290 [Habropoda laboriosa]